MVSKAASTGDLGGRVPYRDLPPSRVAACTKRGVGGGPLGLSFTQRPSFAPSCCLALHSLNESMLVRSHMSSLSRRETDSLQTRFAAA